MAETWLQDSSDAQTHPAIYCKAKAQIATLHLMDIVAEVKKLGLRLGEYVVVGSGALAIRNIRPAHDIDLLITQTQYDELKAAGWKEEHFKGTGRPWVLFHGVFDVSTTWSVNDYKPKPEQLIRNADVIDGVAFVNLNDLLKWKKACRREKDLADITLMEEYLKRKS